ncbi:MAG: RNA-binding S4 domain-containing protein [Bacteroidales bacterium]|nr:RNA-binding S4 domain-containing protein [Bacteroidales bacterium]
MNEFYIETEYINLMQLLKALNIALTGGDAKDMIDTGEVVVNEELENRYRRKLYPGDIVKVMGQEIEVKNEKATE